MKLTWEPTFIAYAHTRTHGAERVFALTYSPAFSFIVSLWHRSWHWGLGYDDDFRWYGIFISRTTFDGEDPYWVIAVSKKFWWESR